MTKNNKEICKQYYLNHREDRILKQKRYYKKNKKKVLKYHKYYYIKNRNKIKKYIKKIKPWTTEKRINYIKQYQNKNANRLKDYYRKYRDKNKNILEKKKKRYYKQNKQNILARNKRYYVENYGKIKEAQKIYYEKNKKHFRELAKIKIKKRLQNDMGYKIEWLTRNKIRVAFHHFLKTGKFLKSQDNKLDYKGIISHLIKTMPKDWKINRKKYNIDHKIPVKSFNILNSNEFKKAFAPENHQWLTIEEHLKKTNSERKKLI